jgi:hypothetical protein
MARSREQTKLQPIESQHDIVRSSSPLNFKVPTDFRREFKTYAAQNNKKLNQLLFESFEALKAKNG